MFSWPQDFTTNFQFFLRWLHFLAGITWIGMLYFFNLVNVQFQKELDGATKGKVVPILMPKALFWFRWGAVFTWFSGFIYYSLIVGTEAPRHMTLVIFLIGWSIAFTAIAGLFRGSVAGGLLKDGRVLALAIAIVVIFIGYATALMAHNAGSSSRSISIMVGGGIGTIMFLNVWMIIWPLQKKILAATKASVETGAPAPADQALWARRAFLASRTNAWLSVPMLFFMGAASHFPIFSVITK
jgi:uncharacterized membrane protein